MMMIIIIFCKAYAYRSNYGLQYDRLKVLQQVTCAPGTSDNVAVDREITDATGANWRCYVRRSLVMRVREEITFMFVDLFSSNDTKVGRPCRLNMPA